MSYFDLETLLAAGAAGLDGDSAEFHVAANHWLSRGDETTALVALDRAHGLAPDQPTIAAKRAALLDRFAVTDHGLVWRYVPAGTFLMGSTSGDPDERPVHPVRLDAYWIAEVPMTWSDFARLAGWSPPPLAFPEDPGEHRGFPFHANKIRMQYCWSESTQVRHLDVQKARKLFGDDPHDFPVPALAYDRKPMIAVDWLEAEELAARLSTETVEYALPSEAEWEKAARGGLIGRRYPWGDEPPTTARCDFNHFGGFRIADPRCFPPNGYGLHGMSGGAWEWTSTNYDSLAHLGAEAPDYDPALLMPRAGQHSSAVELQHRVMRGGSWSDPAAAVTVSFRGTAVNRTWRPRRGDTFRPSPNIGFRLVRRVRGAR